MMFTASNEVSVLNVIVSEVFRFVLEIQSERASASTFGPQMA